MQRLSEAPGSPPHTSLDRFVPYSAQLRARPIRGRRFETIRDLEKEADRISSALQSLCGTGVDFDVTDPVAYTRQFGNKGARFSFHGNACVQMSFTGSPVGTRTVVNAGEFKTGVGAANASNTVLDPELDTLVKSMKDDIETATGVTVDRIQLANVIYGRNGYHFPI